jgi:pimeloyl-ACP methyl ester carboxylesterase
MTEVVMLPGLDGTAKLRESFCSRLAQHGVRARAIAYPPDRPLGYDELELFVRAQLSSSDAFILLGESFSGPLAVRIAANPPAGLVGLVLSTTFARAPVPALVPFASLAPFVPARPPMSLLAGLLLGAWATPVLKSTLAEALRAVHPAVLRARAAAALRADVTALLPSVRVPTLQLVASHDRLLARSTSRILASGLPHGHTVSISGPHLLLQTATEPCAQEVVAFMPGSPSQ